MTRPYAELLAKNPAWPSLAVAFRDAANHAQILPPGPDRKACLLRLQVTTRSNLGAVAHETGGVLVDGGWLRLLGCGCPRLPRALGLWNDALGLDPAEALVVADDVIGGTFAINGGGLPGEPGNMNYFAPDALGWEDLGLGHSGWLDWVMTGNLETFYEGTRWPGWQAQVASLPGDQTFHTWPPPWSREGKDPAVVSRRAVPSAEAFSLLREAQRQLAGG